MYNIEYTEDNPQECSRCGDEACFDKACEKEVEMEKFCKCGEPMQPIYSQGETRYFCGVCQPEVDRAATDPSEYHQTKQEMEIDDGYSN